MTTAPNNTEPTPSEEFHDNQSGRSNGFGFAVWCLKIIGYIVVMGMGAIYGVSAYKYFAHWTGNATGGSGHMLTSFLVGVPFAIGMLVGFVAMRRRLVGVAGAGLLSTLSISLFVFAAGAWLREGTICIVMAIPIFIVLAIVGAILGAILDAVSGSHGTKLMSVALVLPIVAAPFENDMPPSTIQQSVKRSIHIAAKPEVIWRHINDPHDIKPEEMHGGFAYAIGVPYPAGAKTIDGRVGGKRESHWQRGVSFDEIITEWRPNQRIAWRYGFRPDSFPEGSLDDHILIGGRYFNLENTSYTLTPEDDGTRLTIEIETSITTNFNWYAGMWGRFLVGDTAEALLRFYKLRSERPAV